MTLNRQVNERAVINRVKSLASILHAPKDYDDKESSITADQYLFAIHQEIDQYLFGGDGNLTYVGKVLTLKEKEKI